MSPPGGRRSEDDLRAAFAAKAAEAPKAEDVLRAVRRELRPRRSRLRWLVPAVAVAAGVAIAVPVALNVNGSNGHQASSPKRAAEAASPGAGTAASAAPLPKAPMSAAGGVCRPDEVRTAVTLRRDAGVERATLTVTARTNCQLARIPRVTWDGARVRPAAPVPAAGSTYGKAATSAFGRLAAGATATATIQADGPCSARSGDVVRIDWGAGEVEVRATGETLACTPQEHPAVLNVGPFTGLS